MSRNGTQKRREVSPLTLAIAALASAAAAIVTSYFWKGGTIMTAALTPVIVALVKEALQRPIDSGVVTRPVQRMAEARTRAPVREREHVYSGAPPRFEEPPAHDRPPSVRRFGGEPAPQMSPVRTYGRQSGLRRVRLQGWHLKAALVTGLIAFTIALAALTLPELVFGGSVSGHGTTTFFSHSSKKSSSTKNQQNTDTTQTNTNQTTAPPAQGQQGTQTSTQPQQQQTAPSQTPPGGTPAPQQSPAPATPPAQPSP